MSPLLRTVGWISCLWGGLNGVYCIYRFISAFNHLAAIAQAELTQPSPTSGVARGGVVTTMVFYVIWCVLGFLVLWGGIDILSRRTRSLVLVTHVPGAIAGVGIVGCITLLAFERLGGQALAYMLGFGLAVFFGISLTVFNNLILNQEKYLHELDA